MNAPWKRRLRIALAVLVGLLAVAQLVPTKRTNPPVTQVVPAPPEVLAVLRESCWDCHSNETAWPWYSRVAPVKFLLSHDVEEGRRHLNFTEWDRMKEGKRAHAIEEVHEQTSEGEMPPWFYLPLHREARLTKEDLAVLEAWARSAGDGSEEREDGRHGED